MVYKVPLKNSKKKVLIDADVYDFLAENPYYQSIRLLENLREHSSGCCVFQKSWKRPDGEGYSIQTIYLHKLICERWVSEAPRKNFNVIAKNGNKLDCRLENLEWRTKGYIARKSRPVGEVPYRGVSKDRERYRAEIYKDGDRIYLGTYDTAEAASEAYNKKAKELFGALGEDVKMNIQKFGGQSEADTQPIQAVQTTPAVQEDATQSTEGSSDIVVSNENEQ